MSGIEFFNENLHTFLGELVIFSPEHDNVIINLMLNVDEDHIRRANEGPETACNRIQVLRQTGLVVIS